MASVSLTWAIAIVVGYLIGSFPTAYLLVRRRTGQDLRHLGDGNLGAENVARVLGPRAGVLVGAVDITKGVLVILLAQTTTDSTATSMIAGISAVLGHSCPVFLRGHGGRGAATATGVLLALLPYPAVPLGALTALVVYFTRSTTQALSFFYIANLLGGLLTLWFLPRGAQTTWPLNYSYSTLAYALTLPVLVGAIHWFSLRRRPPEQRNGAGSM